MLKRSTRFHRLFSRAALIAALVFLLPVAADAVTIPAEVTLETDIFAQIMDRSEVLSWYREEKHFIRSLDRSAEIEDVSLACESFRLLCQAFISRSERGHIILARTIKLYPDALKASVAAFAEKADREPKNARLKVENGETVITVPAESGILVDHEQSFAALEAGLSAASEGRTNIRLVSTVVPAKISAETLSSLGITELIGSGHSNFAGSPKNRIYNINRSLEQFQGIIVLPGEEFSFVEYLGEVDEANGYLPELVIKNNKTEPEFGGGVCQVSSTIFRAAIYSGMKITERRNHSYPVQYYRPYGMDATIYIPKPDFKFRNNTAHAILMQSVIEGTKLTFQFFGTKDGRNVSVDGPYILESNPDGSMKTTFTQIVKDASGAEMIKDEFKSNYKSPSLFPHPGEEQKLLVKPEDWSNKQWAAYKKLNP